MGGYAAQTKVAELDARCAAFAGALQRAEREAAADKDAAAALRAAVARLQAQACTLLLLLYPAQRLPARNIMPTMSIQILLTLYAALGVCHIVCRAPQVEIFRPACATLQWPCRGISVLLRSDQEP